MDRTVNLKMHARLCRRPDIWSMAAHSVETADAGRAVGLIAGTAAIGVAGGAFISLFAFLLARYGPVGDDWSFRGNGALAAYSVVPALVAGGLTALVLRHRGRPWLAIALGASLVGLSLSAADAALLPAFGRRADDTAGPLFLIALAAWTVVAPIIAMRTRRGATHTTSSLGVSVAAGAVWVISVLGGLVVFGLVFPAGS
jgi:hypothetical protein